MVRKNPPTYVLVISTLGVIFVILGAIAIYQRVRDVWPLYYGAVLLIAGAILLAISGKLTHKYMKPAK